MTGKIVLITGANSGIGRETALALARMGAHVVLLCRDRRRGEEATRAIRARSGNPSVELMLADLSSQRAIREVADEFRARHPRLHVLVNNAAVALRKRRTTVDGLEMTFAVNHLGYFLLTGLLVDRLEAGAPARIVNVSSAAHKEGRIDFGDLQAEREYRGFQVYCNTKLANVLFTYELARRLKGTGVTANCLHPGVVATKIYGKYRWLWGLFAPLLLKSAEVGAATPIHLASAPEVEHISGKYFVDKRDVPSCPASYDEALARRLWEVSAQLVGRDW